MGAPYPISVNRAFAPRRWGMGFAAPRSCGDLPEIPLPAHCRIRYPTGHGSCDTRVFVGRLADRAGLHKALIPVEKSPGEVSTGLREIPGTREFAGEDLVEYGAEEKPPSCVTPDTRPSIRPNLHDSADKAGALFQRRTRSMERSGAIRVVSIAPGSMSSRFFGGARARWSSRGAIRVVFIAPGSMSSRFFGGARARWSSRGAIPGGLHRFPEHVVALFRRRTRSMERSGPVSPVSVARPSVTGATIGNEQGSRP